MENKRAITSVEIHPILANRWSPRGFDTNKEVSTSDIESLIEAVRWSASAGNTQPWRVIIGNKFGNQQNWESFLECLEMGNKIWCQYVPLFVAIGRMTQNAAAKPLNYGVYDCGHAAAALTFQAESLGLKVHQMAGIYPDKIKELFQLNDTPIEFTTILAIGYQGDTSLLNDDLQKRELLDRSRLTLDEIIISK